MITFAGVPLCMPDADRELTDWLERNFSLDDMRLWGDGPVAAQAGNWNTVGDTSPRIGLPMINWPAPPRMKINTLWWPTGATRWARGLFIASNDQMTAIWEAIQGTTDQSGPAGGSTGRGTLVLGDDVSGDEISAEMLLLTPRPFSYTGEGFTPLTGWILPLVCERYLWQWYDAGDLSAVTTWEELQTALESVLYAIDIPDGGEEGTFDEAYGIPDPREMCRSYENAAVLLDAFAQSVGKRIVWTLDGQLRMVGASWSSETAGTNASGVRYLAGNAPTGVLSNVRPPAIRVAFPAYSYLYRTPECGYRIEEKDLAGEDGIQNPDNTLTIFTSAGANYKTADWPPDTSGYPDNSAEVEALANAMAADYNAWITDGYDLSAAGLAKDWVIGGLDDYLWFHWGYQYSPKTAAEMPDVDEPTHSDYAAFTRIASLPYNVGLSAQFQQFEDITPQDFPQWYKLTQSLDPTTHDADANPSYWDAEASSGDGDVSFDTSVSRKVRDTAKTLYGGNGKIALCRPVKSKNGWVWEILVLDC